MNDNLIENNYIIIPNFISYSRAKSLAKQFNIYCAENNVDSDLQVQNCSAKYDFIPFVELLVEKNVEVSQLVGEHVLPTYSYARNYRNGNVLAGHVDKPGCDISLTVNLECDKVWDIWIDTPHGREYVSLNPGDAMLYLGMKAQHGREPFDGKSCTQVFLHYVRSNGPYFRCYFDKDYAKSNDEIKTNSIVSEIDSKISKSPIVDYIRVYEGVFTSEECKTILNEYKNDSGWKTSKVGFNGIEDSDYRKCDILNISDQEVIEKNQSVRLGIDNLIHRKAIGVAQKYVTEFPSCCLRTDSGYDLLRYKTGGFFKQHTDSYLEQPRALAMSINLNDDYKGGSLAFFDEEVTIKGGLGSVIIFPANYMYPHQIMEVTKGTRYAIVTWLS